MGLRDEIKGVFNDTHKLDLAAELIEKIAENFAIGFTEWLISSSILKTEIPMNVKLKMYKNQKRL
jgi:hypothetical protein